MLNPARLEALRHKHNLLSRQIEFEEARPAVNRGLVVQLKREKMKVKETITGTNYKPDFGLSQTVTA